MEHNIADLEVRQEPSKNKFVVKGNAKGQQIVMTFYTSIDSGFKGKIPNFVSFYSSSTSSSLPKILMNEEQSLTFDAVENKDAINKIKITEKENEDCKFLFVLFLRHLTFFHREKRSFSITLKCSI